MICNFCFDSDCGCDDYADREDYGDYEIDGVGFADPGGNSSLRAETESNPRNLPCGNCGNSNRLTPIDVRNGYQCDECADIAEGKGY